MTVWPFQPHWRSAPPIRFPPKQPIREQQIPTNRWIVHRFWTRASRVLGAAPPDPFNGDILPFKLPSPSPSHRAHATTRHALIGTNKVGGGRTLPIRLISKLDAQSGRRVDGLDLLVALREAGIHIRHHHARIEIDALDRPIINQEGNEVRLAGAFAAADMNAGASAWRSVVVVLVQVIKRADHVELGIDRVFRADKEDANEPVVVIGVKGGPLGRPKFLGVRKGRGMVAWMFHPPMVLKPFR